MWSDLSKICSKPCRLWIVDGFLNKTPITTGDPNQRDISQYIDIVYDNLIALTMKSNIYVKYSSGAVRYHQGMMWGDEFYHIGYQSCFLLSDKCRQWECRLEILVLTSACWHIQDLSDSCYACGLDKLMPHCYFLYLMSYIRISWAPVMDEVVSLVCWIN